MKHAWNYVLAGRTRNAQLDQVKEAYETAANGTPQFVILRGISGVGKTRLLQELYSWLIDTHDPGHVWPTWDLVGATDSRKGRVSVASTDVLLPKSPEKGLPFLYVPVRFIESPEDRFLLLCEQYLEPLLLPLFWERIRRQALTKLKEPGSGLMDDTGADFSNDRIKDLFDGLGLNYAPKIGWVRRGVEAAQIIWRYRVRGDETLATEYQAILARDEESAARMAESLLAVLSPLVTDVPTVPVVLVLDDAQWMDRLTLSFLRKLAIETETGMPLIVVATHRAENWGEPKRRADTQDYRPPTAFQEAIAPVRSAWRVDIELEGLLDETDALADIARAEFPGLGEQANELVRWSSGIPLYLIQVLMHLGANPTFFEADGALREGFLRKLTQRQFELRQLLQSRLDDVFAGEEGRDKQKLLVALSMCGERVDRWFATKLATGIGLSDGPRLLKTLTRQHAILSTPDAESVEFVLPTFRELSQMQWCLRSASEDAAVCMELDSGWHELRRVAQHVALEIVDRPWHHNRTYTIEQAIELMNAVPERFRSGDPLTKSEWLAEGNALNVLRPPIPADQSDEVSLMWARATAERLGRAIFTGFDNRIEIAESAAVQIAMHMPPEGWALDEYQKDEAGSTTTTFLRGAVSVEEQLSAAATLEAVGRHSEAVKLLTQCLPKYGFGFNHETKQMIAFSIFELVHDSPIVGGAADHTIQIQKTLANSLRNLGETERAAFLYLDGGRARMTGPYFNFVMQSEHGRNEVYRRLVDGVEQLNHAAEMLIEVKEIREARSILRECGRGIEGIRRDFGSTPAVECIGIARESLMATTYAAQGRFDDWRKLREAVIDRCQELIKRFGDDRVAMERVARTKAFLHWRIAEEVQLFAERPGTMIIFLDHRSLQTGALLWVLANGWLSFENVEYALSSCVALMESRKYLARQEESGFTDEQVAEILIRTGFLAYQMMATVAKAAAAVQEHSRILRLRRQIESDLEWLDHTLKGQDELIARLLAEIANEGPPPGDDQSGGSDIPT